MDCCDHHCQPQGQSRAYRRVLWIALGINAAMFLAEIFASLSSASVSLRADALDFLGDAANYAIALVVAGLALRWRTRTALLKGAVMGAFGLWVAASAVYHAFVGTVPRADVMGAVALVALAANLVVAALLYRHRTSDSQALSVWLCTRNDCIANLAVLLAGAGVWASGTPWPDIAVAAIIAGLGLSSARQVVRQAWSEMHQNSLIVSGPLTVGKR